MCRFRREEFDFRALGDGEQATSIAERVLPETARLATPSRSSASAAIHPDIRTMGMPGPGWAAPPAR